MPLTVSGETIRVVGAAPAANVVAEVGSMQAVAMDDEVALVDDTTSTALSLLTSDLAVVTLETVLAL